MTQYVEHYRCNGAPCVHVDPALPLVELDYLVGLSPPRYPLPSTIGIHLSEDDGIRYVYDTVEEQLIAIVP